MRRDFLVGLSLANLTFSYSWILLLYTDPSQYYGLEFPPDWIFACMVLVEVLLFAVLCWAAITIVRRFNNPWFLRMGKLVFMLLFGAVIFSLREVAGTGPLNWIYWLWDKIGSINLCVLAAVVFLSCLFVMVRKGSITGFLMR